MVSTYRCNFDKFQNQPPEEPMSIIFKCHFDFDKFQSQPPGEPREHHLGEVVQGRSKSKFNIKLSYSIVFFSSGFHNPNYLKIQK